MDQPQIGSVVVINQRACSQTRHFMRAPRQRSCFNVKAMCLLLNSVKLKTIR